MIITCQFFNEPRIKRRSLLKNSFNKIEKFCYNSIGMSIKLKGGFIWPKKMNKVSLN